MDTEGKGGIEVMRGKERILEKEYLTDAHGREAVEFIDRNKDKPFFLFLSFNAVHIPLEAPQKYLDRFNHIDDIHRKTYAAMVSAMDDAIGRVLNKLREEQLSQNTLVIFLNDHGGSFKSRVPKGGMSFKGKVTPQSVPSVWKKIRDNSPFRGGKGSIEEGGIRVALTREDDTFLVLQERPEIARRLNADLFISLHADSAGDSERAYGASVYTLSREASSEAAARFANRENNADLLNGVVVKNQSDPVNDILVELSQRRVQETSREFGQLIEREGKGKHRFHSQTQRSAALAVLRAPDVPAVLFEVGFLTNADDAAQLSSEEGRQEFATFVARAIRIFFARQSTSEG